MKEKINFVKCIKLSKTKQSGFKNNLKQRLSKQSEKNDLSFANFKQDDNSF